MEETEFDGDRIARLLSRPAGAAITQALVGCAYYRSDPDVTEIVQSCDVATATLIVRRPAGSERRVSLTGGYVLSADGRLRDAVEAATTGDDLREEQVELRLRAFGFTTRVERDDAPTLDAAIGLLARGEMPAESERGRVMALTRKYGSERMVLKLVRQWLALVAPESPSPGDLVIAHVAALRDLGEIDAALHATDLLMSADNGLSRSQQAVLFTQRGALWLDQHDIRADAASLAKARACADRAWAIKPSRHCSLVYQRLNKAEEDVQDAASVGRDVERRRAVRLAERTRTRRG